MTDEEVFDALVLMVDNDEKDAVAMRKMLEKAPIRIKVDVCEDGRTGLDYLRRCAKSYGHMSPDMILFDISGTKADDYGFLETVSRDARLRSGMICALYDGEDPEAERRAIAAGASTVISPHNLRRAQQSIRDRLVDSWFQRTQQFFV
ncbi:response regulator [Rhodobium gokarnense]|uniref:PleD family two-component response regulator n=1 Tax=Rhodobium gokarnense TaxID=364296 RepID=A0ABT3H6W3_9HYPH|nr:hypothetical protein [Rhodobium gokarnense]MCW2306061.1 PleD family two-component response regulator [Rhodobium gokarnense]